MINGLHHITAISSDARKTIEFYTKILGLRLVKKTVNFDAPDTYHFYFGNEKGEPGTILTFFPFADAGTGMRGVGQATKIQFSVPEGSLGFWIERFQNKGIKYEKIEKKFDKSVLKFYDFDGLQLEFVMLNDTSKEVEAWTEEISKENAITSFFGVELSVRDKSETEKVLVDLLDYQEDKKDGYITRYISKTAQHAKYVDIFEMPGWPEGRQSAGTVHHVAFRTENDYSQELIRKKVLEADLTPTPMIDRNYFHSVYFREPGGVLFEIATDEPGFDVDEELKDLGKGLMLPEQYESQRDRIESLLPDVSDKYDTTLPFVYKHIKPKNGNKNYFLLLHGTGTDENNLIPLAQELESDFGIVSLRGNVVEGSMRRFFKRKSMQEFDRESIDQETEKLKKFIDRFSEDQEIEKENIFLLGFSNGANIGISLFFSHPNIINKGIFSHPMIPFEPEEKVDLKDHNAFISSGDDDPFLRSEDEIDNLKEIFEKSGAIVDHHHHDSGHSITDSEFEAIKEFINKNKIS